MATKPSSTNSSEPEDAAAATTPETTTAVNNNTDAVATDTATGDTGVDADAEADAAEEEDPAALLNFTKIADIAQERRVFELYKSVLIYILTDLEK